MIYHSVNLPLKESRVDFNAKRKTGDKLFRKEKGKREIIFDERMYFVL